MNKLYETAKKFQGFSYSRDVSKSYQKTFGTLENPTEIDIKALKNAYELIKREKPCRFHLDLEHDRNGQCPPDEELLQSVVENFRREIQRSFSQVVDPADVVILECTNNAKFS